MPKYPWNETNFTFTWLSSLYNTFNGKIHLLCSFTTQEVPNSKQYVFRVFRSNCENTEWFSMTVESTKELLLNLRKVIKSLKPVLSVLWLLWGNNWQYLCLYIMSLAIHLGWIIDPAKSISIVWFFVHVVSNAFILNLSGKALLMLKQPFAAVL